MILQSDREFYKRGDEEIEATEARKEIKARRSFLNSSEKDTPAGVPIVAMSEAVTNPTANAAQVAEQIEASKASEEVKENLADEIWLHMLTTCEQHQRNILKQATITCMRSQLHIQTISLEQSQSLLVIKPYLQAIAQQYGLQVFIQ